jgi:hypothetical protein
VKPSSSALDLSTSAQRRRSTSRTEIDFAQFILPALLGMIGLTLGKNDLVEVSLRSAFKYMVIDKGHSRMIDCSRPLFNSEDGR